MQSATLFCRAVSCSPTAVHTHTHTHTRPRATHAFLVITRENGVATPRFPASQHLPYLQPYAALTRMEHEKGISAANNKIGSFIYWENVFVVGVVEVVICFRGGGRTAGGYDLL